MNDGEKRVRLRPRKQRVGIQLPEELIESVRDVVYWTPGMTLNRFAEIAFSQTLQCMESLRGSTFPPRCGSLSTGKIIK